MMRAQTIFFLVCLGVIVVFVLDVYIVVQVTLYVALRLILIEVKFGWGVEFEFGL